MTTNIQGIGSTAPLVPRWWYYFACREWVTSKKSHATVVSFSLPSSEPELMLI